MSVIAVIEAIAKWSSGVISRLRDFVGSAAFKAFIRKVVAWIESAVLWSGNAIAGVAGATVR